MDRPVKAVAYYRSAVESQAMIDTQKEQAQKYASQHGIEIIHEEIDNGVSGLSLRRPGLTHLMMEWVLNDQKQFEIVLMTDVARIDRSIDPVVLQLYENECDRHGRKLIFINGL